MTKYHIKKDGSPGICKAQEGACPLGGTNEHFDSPEQAQQHADKQNRLAQRREELKAEGVFFSDIPKEELEKCLPLEIIAYVPGHRGYVGFKMSIEEDLNMDDLIEQYKEMCSIPEGKEYVTAQELCDVLSDGDKEDFIAYSLDIIDVDGVSDSFTVKDYVMEGASNDNIWEREVTYEERYRFSDADGSYSFLAAKEMMEGRNKEELDKFMRMKFGLI